MNPEHKVYDDHDEKPITGPDLHALETGKKTSAPHEGRLSTGPQKKSDGNLFNPKGDSAESPEPLSTDALHAAELEGGGSVGGGLFNANEKSSQFNRALRVVGNNRKKALIGGGATAGIATIVVAGFLMVIPLKIEHIVTNLQDRFFSSSNSAVEKETDRLLGKYIVNKVLPAYKACGNTVSKDCSPKNFSDNPVGRLYRTWANARLENKLAQDYGIEFKYDKASNNWHLKAPGTSDAGDNIGPDGRGLDSDFQRADRSQMRTAIRKAMDGETRWKQVMYRYKVGRLLEGKYGIKRCIMFCGTRDALGDNVKSKKIAAQLYITQRVITPRTESLGIVIECLLNGDSCKPGETQPTSIDNQDGAPSEAENPQTDTKQRQALQALGANFPGTSAEKLTRDYAEISDKGFQRYLFEKALEKIGLGAVASQAADAVPVVGAITTASKIISFADSAGPAVNKLGYITNAAAAASMYMTYRTYADEIHTGHVNATEVGSMVDSLGPGNSGPPSDPEKGGMAGAEGTPLYQNLLGSSSSTKTSLLNSVLPSAAAASSKNSNGYLCDNNKPVPSGKLVCSEEVLGQGNGTLDAAHQFLNQPFIAPITAGAHAISGIVGAIGNIFSDIISKIPGVNSVTELVSNVLQPFFKAIVDLLIPSPFSTNMSGGRKFDMMAAGADVSGNDYAHIGLGGEKLTPNQAATIVNEQQNESLQNFSHQSLFARMFDTNSQYSLVSKIAISIPLSKQTAAQTSLASMLNPLGAASHGFGAIFSGKANAALVAQPDAFGVTQYGYPDGTIPDDPEAYWNAHCSNNASQAYQNDRDFKNAPGGKGWVGQAASGPSDDQTGMPVNNTTNPCLLIKATVGAAGGLMDQSNLTAYDLADQNGNSGGSTTTATGGLTNPFPDGWTPNRLDMGYDGTFKGKIVAPFDGTVTYASSSFSNWGGYIEIKADQKPDGLPTSTLYFAEGVAPIPGQQGHHVTAGTPIATQADSPYGDYYGQGASGAIEWGLAQEGVNGSPTNTYVYGQCGTSAAKSTVLAFSQWAQQKLGLPPPSETGNAGCP